MNSLIYLFEFIFGSSRRLNNIIRYNTRHRTLSENVASHSFYVSLYALLISKILIQRNMKLNVEKILIRAILHDIEECVAGDVLKNVKSDPDMKKAYDKIAILSCKSVLSSIPNPLNKTLFSEWKKHSIGHEGWVVEIADELSGIVYSREQLLMGNKYFETIYEDYCNRLKKLVQGTLLEDLYQSLLQIELDNDRQSFEKDK